MRILIIQTAFIGDVILATPMIKKLSADFPKSKIDFLCRKGNEGLLRNSDLNDIIIWNKKDNKYRALIHIIRRIRKRKYDKIYNLQRFASSGIITALSGAKEKFGFSKNPFSWTFTQSFEHQIGNETHEIMRNLSLTGLTKNDDIVRPILHPDKEDYKSIQAYTTKPYICIAPTSVWFTKQYHTNGWLELIDKLKSFAIFLLGGPDDKSSINKLIACSDHHELINLAGKLSFLESAALMQNAEMNYVNDSAPMHIASAMNANTTAIFCSTLPAFGFGPVSDNAKVVETREKLNCRPCNLHGKKACPEGHFKCARTIRTEDLLNALKL